MKESSKGIYVKFKPEEVEILHNRMKEAGVQNMSAYIRKMALNGYVIIPEWPDLNQVISLHSRISNNLNQYANFIGEMVAKYAESMDLDNLPDPDFYLRRERIRQLYTELYKEKNITKFRNTKISIERKVAA